jgi:hypothetical protein
MVKYLVSLFDPEFVPTGWLSCTYGDKPCLFK